MSKMRIVTAIWMLALLVFAVLPTVEAKTKSKAKSKPAEPLPTAEQQIDPPGEKVIIVDPQKHLWAAYDADGILQRSGTATSGSSWCPDIKRSCRTKVGHFRIYSLGGAKCKSSKYPLPKGGAPMPYCMFFNGGQALHGSNQVVRRHASHGCVRLHVEDVRWLRYNFVQGPTSENNYRGTSVIVKSY